MKISAMKTLTCLLALCWPISIHAQSGPPAIAVHDPVIIRQDGTYYIFATGRGISVWSSRDMANWTQEKPVFDAPPAWAVSAVPTFRGHIWAPDISHHAGRYYLYYSVSAFGKNTSCIGLATNSTLDPRSPDFKWVDHGKIIQSVPGHTNWNAIDPNLVTDDEGKPWLSFGSFWEGLKLVRLAPDGRSTAESPEQFLTIASRKPSPAGQTAPAPGTFPVVAGSNPIEAPFIFKHGGFYFLFASIDYCCRGARSDYKMIVGRAKSITGPYEDRQGVSLAGGGGTILLAGNEHWYGVGHCAVAHFDGTDYLVFHGYDAADERGRAKLRIEKLAWDDSGWPSVVTEP